MAFTWTDQTAAGSRNWVKVASSSDGVKLAVVARQVVSGGVTIAPGLIWTSTDSGATWTERTSSGSIPAIPGHYYSGIASSSDGTKLAATANGMDYIYTSTDSGATWARSSSAATMWVCIASSSDGVKLAACNDDGAGRIYTSTNSGVNWTVRTSAGARTWISIASDSTGTKLAAAVSSGATTGYIYTSTNSGVNWTAQTAAGSMRWISITSSSDGTKLAATVYTGYIYTSTNSGVNWTAQTAAGSRGWGSITSSSDGTKLAATVNAGYIYTSTDSGATWTIETAAGSRGWQNIASSSDGTKLVAVIYGGDIWTGSQLDLTFPTPGNGGTITAASVLDTSLTLNWTKATDVDDAQNTLQYLAYYSLNSTLDSVANIEANGTAVGSYTTDINTVPVIGLASKTTYYFNVIVKDVYGNKAAYAKLTQATSDITTPTPGNSGTITAASVLGTSLTLDWTKATDVDDVQNTLQYLAYYSLSPTLDSIAEIEANGNAVGSYTSDINTKPVIGLTSSTTYYFNVIVKDVAGVKAAYAKLTQATIFVDVTAPVPGNSGTITANSVLDTSLILNWTKSTDVDDAQNTLQYLAYYSLSSILDSVSNIEANGNAVGSYASDINTVPVIGLASSTTYYFNVIVKDVYGNKSAYAKLTQATSFPDVTAPVPGNSGTITAASVIGTSLTLNWTKSTDVDDAQNTLQYLAYYSLDPSLDSVVNIEANGTAVGSYTTDINTVPVLGLTSSTTYYFNIIVKDVYGNKSAYAKLTQTTISSATGSSGGIWSGLNRGGYLWIGNPLHKNNQQELTPNPATIRGDITVANLGPTDDYDYAFNGTQSQIAFVYRDAVNNLLGFLLYDIASNTVVAHEKGGLSGVIAIGSTPQIAYNSINNSWSIVAQDTGGVNSMLIFCRRLVISNTWVDEHILPSGFGKNPAKPIHHTDGSVLVVTEGPSPSFNAILSRRIDGSPGVWSNIWQSTGGGFKNPKFTKTLDGLMWWIFGGTDSTARVAWSTLPLTGWALWPGSLSGIGYSRASVPTLLPLPSSVIVATSATVDGAIPSGREMLIWRFENSGSAKLIGAYTAKGRLQSTIYSGEEEDGITDLSWTPNQKLIYGSTRPTRTTLHWSLRGSTQSWSGAHGDSLLGSGRFITLGDKHFRELWGSSSGQDLIIEYPSLTSWSSLPLAQRESETDFTGLKWPYLTSAGRLFTKGSPSSGITDDIGLASGTLITSANRGWPIIIGNTRWSGCHHTGPSVFSQGAMLSLACPVGTTNLAYFGAGSVGSSGLFKIKALAVLNFNGTRTWRNSLGNQYILVGPVTYELDTTLGALGSHLVLEFNTPLSLVLNPTEFPLSYWTDINHSISSYAVVVGEVRDESVLLYPAIGSRKSAQSLMFGNLEPIEMVSNIKDWNYSLPNTVDVALSYEIIITGARQFSLKEVGSLRGLQPITF